MGGKLILFVYSVLILVCFSESKKGATFINGPNVFCNYNRSAQFRPSSGQFSINDIKGSLCTHVTYCTAISRVRADLASDAEQISAFQNKYYPTVKVLLGVQTDLNLTVNAAQDAVKQLQDYDLDGLQIDITLDTDNIDPNVVNDFFATMEQIRDQLDGKLLNIKLGPRISVALGEKLQDFSTVTDFMVVAAYNYSNYLQMKTGLYAPLDSSAQGTDDDALESVVGTLQFYLKKGISPVGLVLEITSTASSFILENPDINGIGAPTIGPGTAGPFTKTPGFLGYNEFCVMLKNGGFNIQTYEQAPYAFNENLWVSYGDSKFVRTTLQRTLELDIKSAAIDITLDDFNGQCGDGTLQFILTQTINDEFGRPINLVAGAKSGISTGTQIVGGVVQKASKLGYSVTTL